MKKLLPKSIQNPKGFTLVELLVVISIIAILSIIGITLFTSAQKNARDGRRRADIESIAAALESSHVPNSTTYPALAATMFASGAIPTDSGNGSATYCVASSTTAGALAPAVPTTWTNAAACPTAPAGYVTVGAAVPAATATAWTVCALFEGSATWFCKPSSQ